MRKTVLKDLVCETGGFWIAMYFPEALETASRAIRAGSRRRDPERSHNRSSVIQMFRRVVLQRQRGAAIRHVVGARRLRRRAMASYEAFRPIQPDAMVPNPSFLSASAT
jgi:hypothetical protein